ncbi:hypothetical protein K501DRAFT_283893 [Backusella circina FSU 941]|nr:hypothetical protein K501DRAFT_283893 [Backusella circina FSU 941]
MDPYSEKQPLTASTVSKQKQLNPALSLKDFQDIVTEIDLTIKDVRDLAMNKIRDTQRDLYQHAVKTDHAAQNSRAILVKSTQEALNKLEFIKNSINAIEPNKPKLKNLDIRNKQFKHIAKNYRTILEDYINLTTESQRYTSALFKKQIKLVNPRVTSLDIQHAVSSSNEHDSSAFVQVLMQRAVIKNGEKTQHIMHAVQDIHQDLRLINTTLKSLNRLNDHINRTIDRYRSRWPMLLQQGSTVYVIDDTLEILEKTRSGQPIDFEVILHNQEKRRRAVMSILTILTILVAVGFIVLSALIS